MIAYGKNEVIQKYRLNDSCKEYLYNYACKGLKRVNIKHLKAAKNASRHTQGGDPIFCCQDWALFDQSNTYSSIKLA
jgi:hypothetical protein